MVAGSSPARLTIRPLTGVRFFLALWVVLYHAQGDLGIWQFPEPFKTFFAAGYEPVSFFFILSGFILAINYRLETRWTRALLAKFALARFARIYPVYLLGLLLVCPFVFFSFYKGHTLTGLGRQSYVGLLSLLLLQSWIPQTAISWNYPGWSLSAEAFFYACFPFLGVALWQLSRNRVIVITCFLLWLAVLIVPGAVLSASLDRDLLWQNFVRYNPLLRLPEFCVGILAAKLFHRLHGAEWVGRGYWLYLPGLALTVLVVMRQRSIPLLILHNGLLAPIYVLVILGLAFGGGLLARALSAPPVVYLGSASYSLYIVHIPVAMWIAVTLKWWASTKLVGLAALVTYLLVAITASLCAFRFLEEPANRFLKHRSATMPPSS